MTNHLSVQLQAPSSTTINPFLLPPLFCKLLSIVPRENWGCYHPHLAECIEIWAHLRQNPWPPPACSAAHIPRLQIHKVQSLCKQRPCIFTLTRCKQRAWIFAIFTVCKTDRIDLIALHPLTPLSACQWNALWLQWLVTHPPQTIQERALFWPSVTLLSNFFSGVLAFLDFWLLIVSLSLADLMQNHNGGLIAVMCP